MSPPSERASRSHLCLCFLSSSQSTCKLAVLAPIPRSCWYVAAFCTMGGQPTFAAHCANGCIDRRVRRVGPFFNHISSPELTAAVGHAIFSPNGRSIFSQGPNFRSYSEGRSFFFITFSRGSFFFYHIVLCHSVILYPHNMTT